VFRKALLRQIQRVSPADVERYRQNSQRLLDFQGFAQHPTCPTLVLAGEYDHFTQPWEHAQFAADCASASCALIHNADHLAQFEQRAACAGLYSPFLRGEALPQRSPGSSLLTRGQLRQLEKRHEPRQPPSHRQARLRHVEGGEWTVDVRELGFFGGLLRGDLPQELAPRGWQLLHRDLPAQPLLPLRQDANGLAFVFPHSDQQASQAMVTLFQPHSLPAAACA
jgi:hypothetical protein